MFAKPAAQSALLVPWSPAPVPLRCPTGRRGGQVRPRPARPRPGHRRLENAGVEGITVTVNRRDAALGTRIVTDCIDIGDGAVGRLTDEEREGPLRTIVREQQSGLRLTGSVLAPRPLLTATERAIAPWADLAGLAVTGQTGVVASAAIAHRLRLTVGVTGASDTRRADALPQPGDPGRHGAAEEAERGAA